MKSNFNYEDVLMWEWADKYPILHTIIEVSPSVITMAVLLGVYKIGGFIYKIYTYKPNKR